MGAFDFLGLSGRPAEMPDVPPAPMPEGVFADDVIPPDPDFSDGSTTRTGVEHPCDQCGNDVQYKGRGRVPKLCPDCKNTPKETASADGPRLPRPKTSRAMTARKEKILGNMQEIAGAIGGGLSMGMPVTGGTIMYTSTPAFVGLLDIAEKYPRMMDGLEKITEVMPWYAVARFAGAVAYAGMVDAGRASPYGLVGESLGVAEVAQHVGYQEPAPAPEIPDAQNPGLNPERPVPTPRRFSLPDGA